MLNRIILMGRLVADPDLKTLDSGTPVCSFRIACDRDFKNKDTGERDTDFVNCVAWRSTAEFVSRYFTKGRMIVVDGRLQVRPYTDRDGNKRQAVEIVAGSVYFGDSKSRGDEDNEPPAYQADGTDIPDNFDPNLDEDDGDLPF